MPTTLKIVDHPATEWTEKSVPTSEKLLEQACPRHHRRCQRLIQTSFIDSSLREGHITASENGFVFAAWNAYSAHHHLVVRPDDVWFAILTQMSFFINAHAEDLRAVFVAHDGKQELEAISNVADFGSLGVQMADMIAKNVVDPELRDWVMPSFTTTTAGDKVVGAILFMGAMQKYFNYRMTVSCGLPSVTLLGEIEDWQKILRRLDKIDPLGEEPKRFANILRPILRHMVRSFEDPTSDQVVRFWNTIVHRNPVGSGTDYLTGWLTAFCFWNQEGVAKRSFGYNALFQDIEFPVVDVDDIPAGFASVPVTVDDVGNVYEATMVAGSVGIAATASTVSLTSGTDVPAVSDISTDSNGQGTSEAGLESQDDSGRPIRDTVQPVSGWWMYENEAPEKAGAREAEKKRLREELDAGWEAYRCSGHLKEGMERLLTIQRRLRELVIY